MSGYRSWKTYCTTDVCWQRKPWLNFSLTLCAFLYVVFSVKVYLNLESGLLVELHRSDSILHTHARQAPIDVSWCCPRWSCERSDGEMVLNSKCHAETMIWGFEYHAPVLPNPRLQTECTGTSTGIICRLGCCTRFHWSKTYIWHTRIASEL